MFTLLFFHFDTLLCLNAHKDCFHFDLCVPSLSYSQLSFVAMSENEMHATVVTDLLEFELI